MSSLIRAKKYDLFWEDALAEKDNFLINGRIIPNSEHAEINSYEELLELDSNSSHLENEAIQIIENTFKIDKSDIHNIHTLKKGMTNRSFIFTVKDKRYIMRIPGTGTDKLINRQEEYDVYEQIRDEPYTERVLYLNPKNGYKLSEFLEGTRNSKADSWQDVTKCNLLRKFHQQKHSVNHKFDIWKKVEFYDTLRNAPSAYRDFLITKDNVLKLKPFIENNISNWTLCHIDANADNFLINKEGRTFLIDWEYAGMQDVHVDIAMFAIYAMFDKEQIDELLSFYFQGEVEFSVKMKIYCYIAVCGLLWSNWCEYKRICGVEFGEYSLKQYRYAKEFYKIVKKELGEML